MVTFAKEKSDEVAATLPGRPLCRLRVRAKCFVADPRRVALKARHSESFRHLLYVGCEEGQMGIAGASVCSLIVMGVCTTRWRGLKFVRSLGGVVPSVFDTAGNVENCAGQDAPPGLSSETTSGKRFRADPAHRENKCPAGSVLRTWNGPTRRT